MCCSLDQPNAKLLITAAGFEKPDKDEIIYLQGTYKNTPETKSGRVLGFFQEQVLLF